MLHRIESITNESTKKRLSYNSGVCATQTYGNMHTFSQVLYDSIRPLKTQQVTDKQVLGSGSSTVNIYTPENSPANL